LSFAHSGSVLGNRGGRWLAGARLSVDCCCCGSVAHRRREGGAALRGMRGKGGRGLFCARRRFVRPRGWMLKAGSIMVDCKRQRFSLGIPAGRAAVTPRALRVLSRSAAAAVCPHRIEAAAIHMVTYLERESAHDHPDQRADGRHWAFH